MFDMHQCDQSPHDIIGAFWETGVGSTKRNEKAATPGGAWGRLCSQLNCSWVQACARPFEGPLAMAAADEAAFLRAIVRK